MNLATSKIEMAVHTIYVLSASCNISCQTYLTREKVDPSLLGQFRHTWEIISSFVLTQTRFARSVRVALLISVTL